MESLVFRVPGEPVAKGRPRFRKHGKHVTTYTPQKTIDAEKVVSEFAISAAKANHWDFVEKDTPVCVSVVFYMQIPKSWSKKKREEMEQAACCKNIDLDNLIKVVCDGINNAEIIWHDDAQVTSIIAEKVWSENPGTLISITRI